MSEQTVEAPGSKGISVPKELKETYTKSREAINMAVSNTRMSISGMELPRGMRRKLMGTARHAAYDAATIKQEEKEEIIEQSAIDNTTGLVSKKYFEDSLHREVELSKRDKTRKLEFALMDIDDFGRFNKDYGQRTGDQVLREVGESILQHIRKTDIAGRDGGEEMGIIMPYTGTGDPIAVENPTERVRNAIKDIKLDGVRQVTVSIGTTGHLDGESYEDFFDRADLAMRVAKRLGKNRTVSAKANATEEVIFQDLSNGKKYIVTDKEKVELSELTS